MVRGSFEDFDQWEFVIGRRHVAPPWQNGCVERLIGSIRRECLDHVVVFNERHLRHLLLSYMKYCNKTRTHLSLQKDARLFRAVGRTDRIPCRPILGGLHHQYARIKFTTGTRGLHNPAFAGNSAPGCNRGKPKSMAQVPNQSPNLGDHRRVRCPSQLPYLSVGSDSTFWKCASNNRASAANFALQRISNC